MAGDVIKPIKTPQPFWKNKVISSLVYDRIIRSWPEKVFDHLANPELLKQWFAPRLCADIRPGGIYFFSWGTHGRITGEFTDVIPHKLLRFVWEDSMSSETLVTIELRGVGLKTHLRLTHELFGGCTKWEWNDGHLNEWIFFLDNLGSITEVGEDLRDSKSQEEGWEWLKGTFFMPDPEAIESNDDQF